MKQNSKNTAKPSRAGRKLGWLSLGIVALIVVVLLYANGPSNARQAGVDAAMAEMGTGQFVPVQRGDLVIRLLVPGELKTLNTTSIVSQIEGVAKILWVIPEGSMVQPGDKLIELESEGLEERIYNQRADLLQSQSRYNTAVQDLMMQERENESTLLSAQNAVELARIELEKYKEGSYMQELMTRQSDITIADLELQRATERRDWTKRLLEEGYVSSGELEADELDVKRSEIRLQQARNALMVFENFESRSELLRLENALREAEANLERVRQNNEFMMRNREIAVETAKAELEHEQARLDQLEFQKANTVIYAPRGGMVVYANDMERRNTVSIEVGADVRNRQQLLELPDFSAWVVDAKVHESVIQQVSEGLPAEVRIDAFPQETFLGRVASVSVMPDSGGRWMTPDVKQYTVKIELGPSDLPLKPGMTTKNEIILDELEDVLYVPIQSVATIDGEPFVLMRSEVGVRRQPVKLGKANDQFVVVLEGLEEGDQVMLLAQSSNASLSGPGSRQRGGQREQGNQPPRPGAEGQEPAESDEGGFGERPMMPPNGELFDREGAESTGLNAEPIDTEAALPAADLAEPIDAEAAAAVLESEPQG